jgi:hypothetical protein
MWNTKKITFIHDSKWSSYLEDVYPIPAKQNIPDWFKKLKHVPEYKTVKGCMPFLDSLTAGYILKMPQDFYIKHNFYNEEIQKNDSFFKTAVELDTSLMFHKYNLNLNTATPQTHPIKQLGECPLNKKNKDLPYYKILNPFKIKTPPGYSTLFVPPLNNRDDRFEIISGIVDTDTFTHEINFPIVINGDKYPNLETTIKRGTPYAQCIPFKRDEWKLEIKKEDKKIPYILRFLKDEYKKIFWKKKKWM